MVGKNFRSVVLGALMCAVATPAYAQDAGDIVVRAGVARTKLVDKGDIFVDGAPDPEAGYRTRDAYHGILSGTYFPLKGVGIDLSISSPATTNNVPAGNLAGTPNLGDDEFVLATVGGRFQPLTGRVSPFVAGGMQFQFTTQERDGLGVNLNVPNANGPYVEGGVEFNVTPRWGVFAGGLAYALLAPGAFGAHDVAVRAAITGTVAAVAAALIFLLTARGYAIP